VSSRSRRRRVAQRHSGRDRSGYFQPTRRRVGAPLYIRPKATCAIYASKVPLHLSCYCVDTFLYIYGLSIARKRVAQRPSGKVRSGYFQPMRKKAGVSLSLSIYIYIYNIYISKREKERERCGEGWWRERRLEREGHLKVSAL